MECVYMLKVIIAEKPSVAKNIAEAVGSKNRRDGYLEGPQYLVTWAFGHLLELKDAKDYDEKMSSWRLENYPFIPEHFEYQVKASSENKKVVDEGAKKQLSIIESLIRREDVVGVISACDFDREGQIIGDIILEYINVGKPIERLLLNEWTADEVKQGLEKLIDNTKMNPLRDAGISRQWADWMIGINLTSVATLKYQRGSSRILNVGRVLLPTLKIIYDRDMEIDKFIPEAFHKLSANFKQNTVEGVDPEATKAKADTTYEGNYEIDAQDKFPTKDALEVLLKALPGHFGKVVDKQVEQKREYPQSLFNLSNLQGHITSKEKGWTSDRVLKVAQSLYEKKLITYPRTASLALEETLTEKTEKVLSIVKRGLPYEKEIQFHTNKRVFDNSKVESHSAIMPTYVLPKNLPQDEAIVYEAVKNRFIMQFMPVAEHEEASLTTKIIGLEDPGVFVTKGRIQLVQGWKKVEKIQSKDKELPKLNLGDEVAFVSGAIESKETSPPKRHTEKTLLRVMETCGKKYKEQDQDAMIEAILSGFSIGTPATRAETISKLKSVGYIDYKGKNLFCTDMGLRMVDLFPIQELFDLEYTGRLEKILSEMGKGQGTKQEFLDAIKSFTENSVDLIKKGDFHLIGEGDERPLREGQESLGKCPVCASDIVEGEKGFGCTNWKGGCKFVIWKNDRFLTALKVRPTPQTIQRLLENGFVFSNSFISKKGSKFSAFLTYEKNVETGYYGWKMSFEPPKAAKAPETPES